MTDADQLRAWIERGGGAAYLQSSRWFGGKARALNSVRLAETVAVTDDSGLYIVEVSYRDGGVEFYQLPLRIAAAAPGAGDGAGAIVELQGKVVTDALSSEDFRAALWRRLHPSEPPASRVLSAEQSNSSLLYGGDVFVKLFRRLEPGANPDAEILRFLTDERHFPHVPAFVGAFEHSLQGGPTLLAVAIAAVINNGDAWTWALRELAGFYQRATQGASPESSAVREAIGAEFLSRIAQLGDRTGALHVALAAPTSVADFSPEPLGAEDFAALQRSVIALWDQVSTCAPELDFQVRQRAAALTQRPVAAMKARTHGDYHLGQVLETGSDFVIIDFEGEPARSLDERRRKMSPVRDVAGMLRSLHYAAHAARPDDSPGAQALAEAWTVETTAAFLADWKSATEGSPIRPASDADLDFLLRAFLLEKAIYEVRYELNNRPTWLSIPLRGLRRVLADG